MMELVEIDQIASMRIVISVVLLCLLLGFGFHRSIKKLPIRRWRNIFANIVFGVMGGGVVRLCMPGLLPIAVAYFSQQQGWGLFNALEWHAVIELVIALLLFDLVIYWQHRLMHQIPWLWRFHSVHHSDEALDASTALRFHPLEIALSFLVKAMVIVMLGASVLSVLLFEIILNGMALFNHSNWRLPACIEWRLHPWLVTPAMHRIHHSDLRQFHDKNYGFCLSIWDRVFASFVSRKDLYSFLELSYNKINIGLKETKCLPVGSVVWMLKYPFVMTRTHRGEIHDRGESQN